MLAKKPKQLLCLINSIVQYSTIMSKPKVFVAMNPIPQSAIDLLRERYRYNFLKKFNDNKLLYIL